MTSIRKKLTDRMNQHNIGTYSLAKAASVPESSIKNIIYGKSLKPNYKLVIALAKQLHCDVGDLLSDDDPRKNLIIHQVEERKIDEWNPELHISAVKIVMKICIDENKELSQNEAHGCIEAIYNYAVENNEDEVDIKFACFMVKKALKQH